MPTPRTEQQIIGDQIQSFLSRYGIGALKVGGPIISIIEAASGSDFRTSKDIFDFFKAISLDNSEGAALENIGNSENVKKITETTASGKITVGDSSFTKIQTKIYQGTPAPIVGSNIIYVADASNFTTPGLNTYLYLGRGTSNYEGPIKYTLLTNLGSYWSITLNTATQRFHNLGESVILAQGGKRTISAGTVTQTQQGSASDPVQFSVLYTTYLLDGETSLPDVIVIAKTPGVAGNVIQGSINSFSSAPFTGATVTNPLPISNGLPAEKDSAYRERIRAARQSRSRGTDTACQYFVTGAQAQDEGKIITSALMVKSTGQPSTLYIDDGTGYEEKSSGVSIESLTDLSLGGEQDFQAVNRPVAKAFIATLESAPYTLVEGCELSFTVGEVETTHTFSSGEFANIASATAYEVVASINADIYLGWKARLINSGSGLAVFARSDVNEAIALVPAVGVDANAWLGFPAGKVNSLNLYVDDIFLHKDGESATVYSAPFASWAIISGSPTIIIEVDGTPAIPFRFHDQDFVDAGTGFATVGNNTPEAWVKVFEAKIPGISCSVSQSRIAITSNRGLFPRASIKITGGTLVTFKMFSLGESSVGVSRDYVLDRNTGQIRLVAPLSAGVRLSIGTNYPRSFIESSIATTIPVTSIANLWFSVDGAAEIVPAGVFPSSVYDMTVVSVHPWGNKVEINDASGALAFLNVQVGDQLVVWDTSFDSSFTNKSWRVSYVDAAGDYICIDRPVMNVARCDHTATTLADGTSILLVGGFTSWGKTGATAACEVFDSLTNTFTVVGSMSTPRARHTATLLPSGKVLVVGGTESYAATSALNTCEIYDPTTKLWTSAASLLAGQARFSHRAGYLAGAIGKTIVCGGINTSNGYFSTCYLYNAGADSWAATGSMAGARAKFMMAVSVDKVVVAGGEGTGGAVLSTAEYFSAGAWAAAGVISVARHSGVGLLSSAGTGWVFGGNTVVGDTVITPSGTLDVYDFGTNTWSQPGDGESAAYAIGTILPDTNVAVAFGFRGSFANQGQDWTGAWGDFSSQPLGGIYPRLWAAGATVGNKLYCFGGMDVIVGEPSSSVEAYDDGATTWSQPDPATGLNIIALQGGLTFVRSNDKLQQLTVPVASGYTASSMASLVTSGLKGVLSNAYRTNQLRISTRSYDTTGDVALVAQTVSSAGIGLSVADAIGNQNVHSATVEAGNEEAGTPSFYGTEIRGQLSLSKPVLTSTDPVYDALVASSILKLTNCIYPSLTDNRTSNSQGFSSVISQIDDSFDLSEETIYELKTAPQIAWMPGDRGYIASPYAMGPNDDLSVLIDGDTETKSFYTKMYRNLATVGSYGSTITVTDADASLGLEKTFGYGANGFDFADFALYMKARTKTHDGDNTKRALWRFNRLGFEGNSVKVRYALPTGPSLPLAVAVDNTTDKYTYLNIALGSGPQRVLSQIFPTSRVGVAITTTNPQLTANVQYIFGYLVSSAQRDGSDVVTLTLTLPVDSNGGAVTGHGLNALDTIYLHSSSANFPSGAYAITDTMMGTNQIKYQDSHIIGAVGPTPNIGDVTFDSQRVTLSGSGTIAGDFFYFDSTTGVWIGVGVPTMRVNVYSDIRIESLKTNLAVLQLVPVFYSILNPSGFSVFSNLDQTATAIAAAVNALAAVANSTCPITGTVVGTGAGIIDRATYEESDDGLTYNGGSLYYSFVDGMNVVKATIIPPDGVTNYQLTLKMPISSSLSTNNDWTNEVLKIAPLTAQNVVDWLNAQSVSGLSSVATIEAAARGTKPQITSLTPGSAGSVEVLGGLANSATGNILGSSVVTNTSDELIVSVTSGDAKGLSGGMWVAVDNTFTVPKTVISPTTALVSIVINPSDVAFTFNGGYLWDYANHAIPISVDVYAQVEKQGRFVAYIDTGLGANHLDTTNAVEGDWLYIDSPTTVTTFNVTPANQGIFRIVRIELLPCGRTVIFVENETAEEVPLAACNVKIISGAISIMPGDKISINTPLWGATGTWDVVRVGDSAGTGTMFNVGEEYSITVKSNPNITAISYGWPGLNLGLNYQLVQVIEGTPGRYIKRILSIVPNQADGAFSDIKFSSSAGYWGIGGNASSVISALDKLDFPLDIFQGETAYRYNTGLIGEANKIIYGDPANPSTYPGVAADGARINVSGPIIRRIVISILVRTQSTDTGPISDKVKAAIAAFINRTPFGVSIALSDILKEAGKVTGVKSVVMLSPAMSSASDLIALQPFEKPQILNIDQDISVSFVGV